VFAWRLKRDLVAGASDRPAHQARRKQYKNKPIPKMKKSKNRAKKWGPIIAARRKNSLIDSSSSS
jgi:hypothetical protein